MEPGLFCSRYSELVEWKTGFVITAEGKEISWANSSIYVSMVAADVEKCQEYDPSNDVDVVHQNRRCDYYGRPLRSHGTILL